MSQHLVFQGATRADCPLSIPGQQLTNLLFARLPELNPPGFSSEQHAGIRSLPAFCNHLKLIYGLRALEPLADGPPAATVGALSLSAELLAIIGGFVATNPDVNLTVLRDAAAHTVIHLRPRREESGQDAEAPPRETLLLEAAELALLRRARSAGRGEEKVCCAARMILLLWEFAEQLLQSPGENAGALIHENGWANPATKKILFKLALGCAVGEVVSGEGSRAVLQTPRSWVTSAGPMANRSTAPGRRPERGNE